MNKSFSCLVSLLLALLTGFQTLSAQGILTIKPSPNFDARQYETYFGNENYGVLKLESYGNSKLILIEKGKSALSEFTCNCSFEFQGMSSTSSYVYLFLNGSSVGLKKGNYFLRFAKKENVTPILSELKIPNLVKGEEDFFSFSDSTFFYRVVKNDKLKSLKIIKITEPTNFSETSFTLQDDNYDEITDRRAYSYSVHNNKVDFDISGTSNAFWIDNRLIFAFPTNEKKNLRILELKPTSEQKITDISFINLGKSDYFICDNVLFVLQVIVDGLRISSYDLPTKKLLSISLLPGKNWEFKKTPLYDMDGDSLDSEWTKEKLFKKLEARLSKGFVNLWVTKSKGGNFIVTLINLLESTIQPGGAPSAFGGPPGPSSHTRINYSFFRGCLSGENLKPTDDPDVYTPYTKALLRKKVIKKKKGTISFDHSFGYLTYQNDDENIVIEQFD